ncbi:tricarballylate utilization 4Fe-4S protein TcuB [Ruegeria sp. HKCCD7318]|uniref:tricarballylate utilization 4Fe-4S protein TcuB n=1 Tax=Ruegeria sp. HKCCD7318 TaxID=2683014 RepID=UPI001492CDDF|nr:tricarballylate utilization 4Fe-4S protein TcuB [Ruegeria sp. HKCCD7318]NOE34148.1 tricarballylate utilization 4Fe-4S protein TcuB [Ruegeria sp. HKCCD7318]
MQIDLMQEARRQAEVCNACRYCEGYCSVFPSLHAQRAFSDGDITQLANLCHNCRGCYYACQYTAPHEFDLNLPKALAEVRRDSWESFAWPQPLAQRFHTQGGAIALALVIGFAFMFLAIRVIRSDGGQGFYAVLSHNAMVAIFAPAFLLPLISVVVGLNRYWRTVGGKPIKWADLKVALNHTGKMQDLAAGYGEGCNFEDEDRFSQARRHVHHTIMYGFLLCFASTSVATVMHYGFGMHAPYGFWSLPKLFGVTGGVLLTIGCGAMALLKQKSDRDLGDPSAWGGDIGFILLLGFVGLSGLVLYAMGSTQMMPALLAVHLGSVLTFFLLMPFAKMAHGFYRLAALIRDAQRKRVASV